MQEKIRTISRNYKSAKEDIASVEKAQKPRKPFISYNDFLYWKEVV